MQITTVLDYEVLLHFIDSTGSGSACLNYLSICLSFKSCLIIPVELDTPWPLKDFSSANNSLSVSSPEMCGLVTLALICAKALHLTKMCSAVAYASLHYLQTLLSQIPCIRCSWVNLVWLDLSLFKITSSLLVILLPVHLSGSAIICLSCCLVLLHSSLHLPYVDRLMLLYQSVYGTWINCGFREAANIASLSALSLPATPLWPGIQSNVTYFLFSIIWCIPCWILWTSWFCVDSSPVAMTELNELVHISALCTFIERISLTANCRACSSAANMEATAGNVIYCFAPVTQPLLPPPP